MPTLQDTEFMRSALSQANSALLYDEVPVGAIIVFDNKIIASAHNRNRTENNPIKHAEIIAIEQAANFFNNERLTDCIMYVTKEPCAMCAGAIVHSRIKKLFIGSKDIKYGACGTVISVCGNNILNHTPEIEFGILEEECSLIIKNFFKLKRE